MGPRISTGTSALEVPSNMNGMKIHSKSKCNVSQLSEEAIIFNHLHSKSGHFEVI
jgi:hypothetical protein